VYLVRSGANCQSLKYAGGGPLLCDATTCKYDPKNCTVAWDKALRAGGGSGSQWVQAMTLDSAGNLYVAGIT